MLAASQKPMPNKKPCKPVEIFCSGVLPPLQSAIAATKPGQARQLTTTASIAAHLDHLTKYHHFSTPLWISVHSISNTLLGSLELNLAKWNMTMLARYIFAEAPRACQSVFSIESEIYKVLPPTAFPPTYCGGYLTEKRHQTSCNSFQKTFSQMHVGMEFNSMIVIMIHSCFSRMGLRVCACVFITF